MPQSLKERSLTDHTVKIPSRAMFLTQMYGTILGGFINYAVMASVIDNKRDLLVNSSGNSAWSGALLQGFSTTSASWSMTKYLYKSGEPYAIVPYGVVLGFGIVMIHRLIVYVSRLIVRTASLRYTDKSLLRADQAPSLVFLSE